VTRKAFSTTAARKETFTIQDEEDFQKRVLENPGTYLKTSSICTGVGILK